ncbi:uncharacterized protein LOC115007303 [Cottoperca gobio]|uniref:Uncharacterized protein LOC115007303 n=1 Tax=Cottoperca gobio TaxID=56716 RepID=A0A6J2PKS9_COTGO|nr:uncharacterized protein LOC115007303 [Cottoperca gobio]
MSFLPCLHKEQPLKLKDSLQPQTRYLTFRLPAPLSPNVEQPQAGVTLQPGLQGGPQFLLPTQHYTWSPLGGSPMIIPLQPSLYGSQPANQPTLPQQPLIFPPYRYFPHFSSPYRNQLSSTLGSLSSEELQLAMYLTTVLTNPPAAAVQPVSQAAGLANREQQGIVPTVESTGVPQTLEPASSGPQPNTNVLPVGLERPAQEATTVQTSIQAKLQPTQGCLA